MYDLRQPHDARDLVVRRRGAEKRAETRTEKESEKEKGDTNRERVREWETGRASRVG
jgi:hypothetical protein